MSTDIAPTLVEQIDTLSKVGTSGLSGIPAGQSHLTILRAIAAYADEIAPSGTDGVQPTELIELIDRSANLRRGIAYRATACIC